MVNRLRICTQTKQVNIRYLIITHQYFMLEQIYFIIGVKIGDISTTRLFELLLEIVKSTETTLKLLTKIITGRKENVLNLVIQFLIVIHITQL